VLPDNAVGESTSSKTGVPANGSRERTPSEKGEAATGNEEMTPSEKGEAAPEDAETMDKDVTHAKQATPTLIEKDGKGDSALEEDVPVVEVLFESWETGTRSRRPSQVGRDE
jgi:hypothetical protein